MTEPSDTAHSVADDRAIPTGETIFVVGTPEVAASGPLDVNRAAQSATRAALRAIYPGCSSQLLTIACCGNAKDAGLRGQLIRATRREEIAAKPAKSLRGGSNAIAAPLTREREGTF